MHNLNRLVSPISARLPVLFKERGWWCEVILDSGCQRNVGPFGFPRDSIVKSNPAFVYPELRSLGCVLGNAVKPWWKQALCSVGSMKNLKYFSVLAPLNSHEISLQGWGNWGPTCVLVNMQASYCRSFSELGKSQKEKWYLALYMSIQVVVTSLPLSVLWTSQAATGLSPAGRSQCPFAAFQRQAFGSIRMGLRKA